MGHCHGAGSTTSALSLPWRSTFRSSGNTAPVSYHTESYSKIQQGLTSFSCTMHAACLQRRRADLMQETLSACSSVDTTTSNHILTSFCRYAVKDANMTFSATPLGEALVAGYRAMGLANLWTPDLRGKIEANIAAVAAGQRSKVTCT